MIRRIRLASGLVMLAYVTMHLLNHALGLVSLEAMGWALHHLVQPVWSSAPMLTLLYGAFAVHYALALWALWQRQTLRLRLSELLQLGLGFLIPILLVRHVTANRIAATFLGTDLGHYSFQLWNYFVRAPVRGYSQMTALVVAWSHAMIGLHFWLRVRPWYERWREAALTVAVLVPVVSLLGVMEAGREVVVLAHDPGWTAAAFAAMSLPTAETVATIEWIGDLLTWFFVAMLAAVLVARSARRIWQRRYGTVRIRYANGRSIEVLKGTSVLEASRLARIPHASVCGGRGRCSTCRVRVRAAPPGPPPPSEAEQQVLARIRATANIRLACMLRPDIEIEVTPLLPPFAAARDGAKPVDLAQGVEREIAILFADIRGFTALSEGRLPYDIVFILNRYFAAMGRAVEAAGGRVDKFVGDGVMALFGVTGSPEVACREALAAARLMSQRLVELNEALGSDLEEPLRIGIGIHAGPAIVGEMGYAGAVSITAIGDAVNTASRLEGLAKEFHAELVVSAELLDRAGVQMPEARREEIDIRGKQDRLAVAVFPSARDLPQAIGELMPAS